MCEVIGSSENLSITSEEVVEIRDYCMAQYHRAECPLQKKSWENQAMAWIKFYANMPVKEQIECRKQN